MSPSMGQAVPSSPFGALASGPNAGPDPVQAQLTELMGQIRDVVAQVDQISATYPALAQDAQQVRSLLKGMIVKAAQQAPTQSDSSSAVPMAGT